MTDRGRTMAAVLAGAWRCSPGPLRLSPAELDAVVPLLAAGGAGGLAWHRLRASAILTSGSARELHQHYRLQTLQAARREEAIRALLPRLRDGGVEPILIKGWSSARLYPDPGLRPSCDVDLCVPAESLPRAMAALSGAPLPCAVDLHADVPDLDDRTWDAVLRRSRLVALDDTTVRLLGPEDQLRLMCLHLVRHGIARPLWLCDVAACLESLPVDFDWDYCLAGRAHLAAWVSCLVGLACRLLKAQTAAAPLGVVPSWVEKAVLWCWGVGSGQPLAHYLRRPMEALRRLRYHGISPRHGSMPIKAALQLGLGPSRGLPLVLLQLGAFLRRKLPHVLERLIRPRRRAVLPFVVHHH
jgi:putative nucleotidyltransferase-like protein